MKIKYSQITQDAPPFILPCGCGFTEDIEITDIPQKLAQIKDFGKSVLAPSEFSECVSLTFDHMMNHDGASLLIRLRFMPMGVLCTRLRSSVITIALLSKRLKLRFECKPTKRSYTPAMLAVDLGNTRTCAIVCPDIRQDSLSMEKLELAPHYSANIEPSNGVWDSICVLGKSAVFKDSSPSFVRLGKDNLFYLRNGSSNSTHLRSLSTPKRYFWDADENRVWDLIRPGRSEVYLLHEQTDIELSKHIAESSFGGKYPRAMVLEGAIYEMLEQAERMLNRDIATSGQYKLITHLTMTYPAAWSTEERDAYRAVVQNSINHYISQRCMNAPIELHMECNEATAVLVNYIYSEAHHFGNGETWLRLMGKPDLEDDTERSLRVAVIDIGGGTSDLAIANISWDALLGSTKIETCYTYGTNEAGDALIAKIIKEIILDKLFEFMVLNTTNAERKEILKNFLVKNVIPELKSLSRSFWFPLAVTYLESVEKGDDFEITVFSPRDTKNGTKAAAKSTLAKPAPPAAPLASSAAAPAGAQGASWLSTPKTDAPKADVPKAPEATKETKQAPVAQTSKSSQENSTRFNDDFATLLHTFLEMVDAAGNDLGKGNLSNYVVTPESLTETLNLSFTSQDRNKYRELLKSCFRFSPMIFGSALAAYQCDIVIWSGKTSENKDIRNLFEEQIPVPPSSFISMNDYEIKTDDFPLTGLNGRLSDSKFATAIGAALYSMLQINGNANLSLLMIQQQGNGEPRYWGKINANGRFEPFLRPDSIRSKMLDYTGGLLLIYRSNCDSPLAFPSPAYEFRVKQGRNVESVDRIQFVLTQSNNTLDFELVNGNYTLTNGTKKSVHEPDAKEDFELSLRMVGTNEIWLDTGKIF